MDQSYFFIIVSCFMPLSIIAGDAESTGAAAGATAGAAVSAAGVSPPPPQAARATMEATKARRFMERVS
jgi:hypothetical protein